MLFSKEDFKVESLTDFCSFCLVTPFVVFIGPFLIAGYVLMGLMEITGWLDT